MFKKRAPNILSWLGKRRKCRTGSYCIISCHITCHIFHISHIIFMTHLITCHIIWYYISPHIISDHISYQIIAYPVFILLNLERLFQVPPPRSHRPNHHQSNRQRWYHRYHRRPWGYLVGAPRRLDVEGIPKWISCKKIQIFGSIVFWKMLFFLILFFFAMVFCQNWIFYSIYVFWGVVITNYVL